MTAPVLSVNAVCKRYPGVQALDRVSLAVGMNEVVGLIGQNGSGKSTLLKMLAGLVKPDEGSVLVRGRPFAGGFAAAANAGIGMVFQEQSLILNVTVAENILLGCEGEAVRYGFTTGQNCAPWRASSSTSLVAISRQRRSLARSRSPSVRWLS